jgi:hypothetical protein
VIFVWNISKLFHFYQFGGQISNPWLFFKYWKRFLYGSFMWPFPVFVFAPFRCFIFTNRESYIMSFCFSCFRFHVSTFIVCTLVLHRLNVQTPKHVIIASGLQVKLNLKKKRANVLSFLLASHWCPPHTNIWIIRPQWHHIKCLLEY